MLPCEVIVGHDRNNLVEVGHRRIGLAREHEDGAEVASITEILGVQIDRPLRMCKGFGGVATLQVRDGGEIMRQGVPWLF